MKPITHELMHIFITADGKKFFSEKKAKIHQRKLKNNYVPNKDAVHPLEHINLFNLKSFKTMTKDLNLSILNIDKYYKFDFLKHLRILKNLAKFDKILLRKND